MLPCLHLIPLLSAFASWSSSPNINLELESWILPYLWSEMCYLPIVSNNTLRNTCFLNKLGKFPKDPLEEAKYEFPSSAIEWFWFTEQTALIGSEQTKFLLFSHTFKPTPLSRWRVIFRDALELWVIYWVTMRVSASWTMALHKRYYSEHKLCAVFLPCCYCKLSPDQLWYKI